MFRDSIIDWLFLGRFVIIFLVYLITALIGLQFDAVGGFATLVWPPAGFAIGMLFLLGYEYCLAVFLAALIVNFFTGAPLHDGLLIALGNTLSACSGVYILKNVFNFTPGFYRLKDSLAIIVTAILAPLISSSVGSLTLLSAGIIDRNLLDLTVLTWWLGDVLSILIVGSFILVWAGFGGISLKKINYNFLSEAALLFSILFLICSLSFGGIFGVDSKRLPITQLLYPVLIWFCLRLNSQLSITAVFVVAVTSVWGTAHFIGPFVKDSLEESLLYLLVFVAAVTVTFIILASIMSERKRLHGLKDEFISAASHELRTPVTTIKAYIQLISKKIANKKMGGLETDSVSLYMSRVEEQVERLIKLIYELLDVSRIESGKIELEYSTFYVDELLEEMIKDFHRTTKSHTISFKNHAHFKMSADRYRISQVLVNLISNAIKFSPEGKKVMLSAVEKGRWITISIKDYGIGIEPKYQTEIFERFFQTEHRKLYSASGLGLGLYLSSEIVKKHGGRIWVESELGRGSTFFFSIPPKK